MPQRPAIGEVLSNLARAGQAYAEQVMAGAAKKWITEHREELLSAIQYAQAERGAALIHQFCREVPLAAGLVTLAMRGSPDMAIAAISTYDAALGEQLRQHRGNLEKIQEYYRLGAEQKGKRS
jgi:hypothetical protein